MDSSIAAALITAGAALVAAAITVWSRGRASSDDTDTLTANLAPFFLAGCGVGNRIALLPTDDSLGNNEGYSDFIEALQQIGLSSKQLSPFVALRSAPVESEPRQGAKARVEAYFDAMSDVRNQVRARSSPQQFQWFLLGDLLYGIITILVVRDSVEHVQGSRRSVMTSVNALESLAEEMALPSTLRGEIRKLIWLARAKSGWPELLEATNETARVAWSLL
jgi:hypothetical protein